MAEVLRNLAEQLRSIKRNLPAIVEEVLDENAPEIEDLIIKQLDQGIDGSGAPIEPPYTPFTKAIKRVKGQPTDRVTLQDERDFVKSIKITVGGGKIDQDASDRKYPKLVEKYGDQIIDFTEESKEIIKTDILIPGTLDKIRTRLNL